jgi:hypothetical protein
MTLKLSALEVGRALPPRRFLNGMTVVVLEALGKLKKKSSNLIRNRTCDLSEYALLFL